jgi:UDP-N-acetylmuramoyl-L-alanyl-D-glutamate--2,6-diaminopimelate ligase
MLHLNTPGEAAQWLRARVGGSLQTDSRKLGAGDGFIAWPGATQDARRHVPAALAQGAAACLVEQEGVASFGFDDTRIAALPDLKARSALVAGLYHGQPSQALDVLAVTGTNGKTSTVWWLAQALSGTALQQPRRCAMVGTLGVGFPLADAAGGEAALHGLLATGLTTPDAVLLQGSLRAFVDAGATACAIEASSIGIVDHRLDGTRIHTAIFTNLTQDHLDYHGTMQAYWQAKRRLFLWPGLRCAVVNVDDAHGHALAADLAGAALDLWTVSRNGPARLRASDLTDTATGMQFVVTEGAESHRLLTGLIGHYNVSNLLGVLAAMRSLGVPLEQAVSACRSLQPVPGRMQCVVQDGQPMAVVDYAHTPDALEKALAALRPLAAQRGGQLWCVFGCGGDRDPAKRPLMGAATARGADRVLLTSDNPRSEDPGAILQQIMPGLAGHADVTLQVNRALAIAHALRHARAVDVVLVAGKGHEAYQEIAGRRLPFSDLAEVHKALAARQGAAAAQGVAA